MRDDEDDYDDGPAYDDDRPAYPLAVTLAGVAWIGFGGLILANLMILLVLLGGLAAAGGPQAAGGSCGAVLMGLFAAAFIQVGVQSIRGTAPDTLGNGIGSIVFGLIQYGVGTVTFVAGQAQVEQAIQGVLHFLAGTGLVGAGVLALAGRSAYKEWRRVNKPASRDRRR